MPLLEQINDDDLTRYRYCMVAIAECFSEPN